jgi:hypothetical protein
MQRLSQTLEHGVKCDYSAPLHVKIRLLSVSSDHNRLEVLSGAFFPDPKVPDGLAGFSAMHNNRRASGDQGREQLSCEVLEGRQLMQRQQPLRDA